MEEYSLPALSSVVVAVVYAYQGLRVGLSRAKFGIKAPKTTGNANFERMFRAHLNTLEMLPVFFPAMWLFAMFVNADIAGLLGLVFAVLREGYFQAYGIHASKRGNFFIPSFFLCLGMLLSTAFVVAIPAWTRAQALFGGLLEQQQQ